MDIYGIIYDLCKSRGISVRELERACSFAQGTIKRWSTIIPGIDKLVRVADYFDIPLDELCGRPYLPSDEFEK